MFHALAPAGDFAPPSVIQDVARALCSDHTPSTVSVFNALVNAISSKLEAHTLLLTGSGSEALFRIFEDAKETLGIGTVVLGAYGCPDIVTAAIQSGCRVELVDVDPETGIPLWHDWRGEPAHAIAVVSNLYGVPHPIPREAWGLIVDDASQAYLSRGDLGRVGTRSGTIGVLSFGRGKALSGVGGGAVVASDSSDSRITERLRANARIESLDAASIGSQVVNALSWLFERPSLYWIPQALPFLGLGLTSVRQRVTAKPMTVGQALVMLAQFARSERIADSHCSCARHWQQALQGSRIGQPAAQAVDSARLIVPIRYPILFRDRTERDRVAARLAKAGMGSSTSYGNTLDSFFPTLTGRVRCDGARAFAERLLTLPTHRYVSSGDIATTVDIIRSEVRD